MCEEEAGNRVAFTVGTFSQATEKVYSVNFLKTANKIYFAISSLLFFSILPLPQCQTVSEVQFFTFILLLCLQNNSTTMQTLHMCQQIKKYSCIYKKLFGKIIKNHYYHCTAYFKRDQISKNNRSTTRKKQVNLFFILLTE